MARRKDKESSAGALIILLVIALALVTPFALTAWWIICEIRVAPYKRSTLYEALPSEDEKVELLSLRREAEKWAIEVSRIEDWAISAGARRRMDGGFDGRSRAGQEANERLSAAEINQQDADRRYNNLIQVLAERTDNCVRYVSQTQGARLGVMTFSALFFIALARWGNWVAASLVCGLVSGILIWARTAMVRVVLRSPLSAD